MSDSPIQHFIKLRDGRELEIWYSVNSAKRLRKKYGTFAYAMAEELAETLPDMIYEGLVKRDEISVEEIGEQIAFNQASVHQETVLAAMAGITVEEYRKRLEESKAKQIAKLEKKLSERGVQVSRDEGMTTDEYLMLLFETVAEKNAPLQPVTETIQ